MTMTKRILSIVTIVFLISNFMMIFPVSDVNDFTATGQTVILNNSDWHTDPNSLTDDYNITYVQHFDPEHPDGFSQSLEVRFLDGSEVNFGMAIDINFEPDELDYDNIDWDKATRLTSSFALTSNSEDGTRYNAHQNFPGFNIYKGNASDIITMNRTGEGDTWSWDVMNGNNEEWVASIEFSYGMKIGPMNIVTSPYVFNNTNYTETNIQFDIEVNAGFMNDTATEYFPAILSFAIFHNHTESSFKYGIDMDWTGLELFPSKDMTAGDRYFLATGEVVGVILNDEYATQVPIFVMEGTDTAVWNHNGMELCRMELPTSYDISNGQTGLTPEFIYFEYGTYYGPDHQITSNIFQVFDGFTYGTSSGMVFDPEIILPSYIGPDKVPDSNHITDSDDEGQGLLAEPWHFNFLVIMVVMSLIFGWKKLGKEETD